MADWKAAQVELVKVIVFNWSSRNARLPLNDVHTVLPLRGNWMVPHWLLRLQSVTSPINCCVLDHF